MTASACGKKIVVVVDDEPGFCDTVKEVLEDEGYLVEVAMDGVAGLALVRSLTSRPCLILLDLAMPELDGQGVYRALRADPDLAPIRIVIATSDPTRAPEGADVLAKPLSLDRLVSTVAACCGPGAR